MLTVPGAPGIDVHLRRSARARRMSLRVARAGGQVTLTLPVRMPTREASAFVASQAEWIARNVAAVPQSRPVRIGTTLPLLGREVPVVAGAGRAARFTGAEIAVPEGPRVAPRVKALFRDMARTHLAAAVDRYAEQVSRSPRKITLRDTRSRWGSCSSKGDLMFSWRLIMAPPDVLDYVAAHEVAHLVHMDHSKRFWGLVAEMMPDHAPRRTWLRDQGATLHAVDFSDG
ncbi:MAG: SprT family zinc-dependent metalloprotease [Pseudomonadota bacterium]